VAAKGGAGDGSLATSEEALEAIALKVRGTFQTVETMTQSFIREAILQGVFPPGQRLNLESIATALGVSRMPVRASLRQLEGEGLLRIHPHRGATVSVLTAPEVAEIYEIRIVLECYLLEHAIANLDDDAMDALQVTVDEMEGSEELYERLEQRRRFYQQLYELARRPRALNEVNNLRASVGRYLLLQRVDEPLGHHGKFLALVRSRNVEGAKGWLAAHLMHVSETLERLVGADQELVAAAPAKKKSG
jgi:DNA-binding GntR family transcriptional regulator